jgi:hypothetical protein
MVLTEPGLAGMTDQKRNITLLSADELKYSSSGAISGIQLHHWWARKNRLGHFRAAGTAKS